MVASYQIPPRLSCTDHTDSTYEMPPDQHSMGLPAVPSNNGTYSVSSQNGNPPGCYVYRRYNTTQDVNYCSRNVMYCDKSAIGKLRRYYFSVVLALDGLCHIHSTKHMVGLHGSQDHAFTRSKKIYSPAATNRCPDPRLPSFPPPVKPTSVQLKSPPG